MDLHGGTAVEGNMANITEEGLLALGLDTRFNFPILGFVKTHLSVRELSDMI